MYVILTGATGFIGGEVLTQLISNPAVTCVTALTRKPLSTKSPKVKNIVLEDFTSYPPSIQSQQALASACIFALGSFTSSQPLEESRKANVDTALAAANAFAKLFSTSQGFNFVYTSGFLTERDPTRNLWIRGDFRKMRGSVETQLLEMPNKSEYQPHFQTFVARPAFVSSKNPGFFGQISGAFMPKGMAVRVDELAAAMIDVALNGGKRQIWENAELVDRGRDILGKTAKEGTSG